ncbi:MAG: GNAT family N-acetyltransferase [Oscillospiraceae bacterium]|nr:GNAT family N-acetyltransferase [Oscillospiraceae bacterium]
MILPEQAVVLKDGTPCTLRSPGPEEAELMLAYLRQISAETEFMVRYPDEITTTPEEERALLAAARDDAHDCMLSAYVDGRIVGNCSLHGNGPRRKLAHRAQLGIAILRNFWHLCIASHLLDGVLEAARQTGCETVELTAVRENERAVALYERYGFRTLAIRPRGFKLDDGRYLDEVLMLLDL